MAGISATEKTPISLPKGGGAVKGIGETFQPNPFSGTADLSLPVPTSPGRSGFGPKLSLTYSTGNGNGPFGLGWTLAIPRVTRKTEKGLPTYTGADVFVVSGTEDLLPQLTQAMEDSPWEPVELLRGDFHIARFRPRTEGGFTRVEQWTRVADGDVHWRSVTRDGVTSIFGRSPGERIADPDQPANVFEWLLGETFDLHGNHVLYEYVREDADVTQPGIHERNRRPSQTYLRRILYGNTPDDLSAELRAGLTREGTDGDDPLQVRQRHYVFEVLFDYGDLGDLEPVPGMFPTDREDVVPSGWPVRADPFSTFRSGFELRTLRRCRRILMLHHFREEEVDGAPLVKSTDFSYSIEPRTQLSRLESVTVRGYRRDPRDASAYLVRDIPPATFTYSELAAGKQRYQPMTAAGGDLPPEPLGSRDFTLMDVHGNALQDVVHFNDTGFHYWRNLGGARFDRRRTTSTAPPITLSQEKVAIGDVAGNGLSDLIVENPPLSGFFESMSEGDWRPFKAFESMPSVGLSNPDTRLVDLTGDGLSDVLITLDDSFLWYRCLGAAGYEEPRRVPRRRNLDEFPDVFFSDPAGRVRLADMSGDGLDDIVLVHDGRIDYWPNLGYGRFGRRMTMGNAPRVGIEFDPRRFFLVDVDGTGCADAVYVDVDRVHFWFNQSGNAFSDREVVTGTPRVNDAADVRFADVFGSGTATLIWSYRHGEQRESNYKVLDVCGSRKPHLLVEMDNGLGAFTRVHYASSTKFLLEDEARDTPWVTNLPFPVHVVESTEVVDRVGRTRLVTRYRYHHGYFDGAEREFRGFGMVEQFDTEEIGDFIAAAADSGVSNADETSHVPPVHTKTWFHTGAFRDGSRISRQYEHEYYREPGLSDEQFLAQLLPDTILPADLPVEEAREAARVLRGSRLRQEVYALDGSAKAPHPYTVSECSYAIKRVQPHGPNAHAVFFTHPLEAIDYHYERNPADPRVAHTLRLQLDDFAHTLKEASVAYGRRQPEPDLAAPDQGAQARTLVTYAENRVTNAIDTDERYRTPLPCETRTYELTGYVPSGPAGRFVAADFVSDADPESGTVVHAFDEEIPYESTASSGRQRRLIDEARTLFRPDDFGESSGDVLSLLPLGIVEPLALLGESYQLAFTPGLLEQVFVRDGEPLLPDAAAALGTRGPEGGGYVDLDGDGRLWVPSGRTFLSPGGIDGAAGERLFAGQHFFLPHRTRDPFHTEEFNTESILAYDIYDLMGVEARDALGNRITTGERNAADEIDPGQPGNDYRVLQARLVTDANGNRSAVAFDAFGMVVGTAVMGKRDENVGDSLSGFEADLEEDVALEILADPFADPLAILGRATSRLVYDPFAYLRTAQRAEPQPSVVYRLARETHDADLEPGQQPQLRHSFTYSNGLGREVQRKAQAEPGPVPQRDADGEIVTGPDGQPVMTEAIVARRWVGSGWTVFNNKGAPVRQYEPFFTDTHRFEDDTRFGVSPVHFYDPVARVVATLHANHTWEKLVFDAWRTESWDVNDTIVAAPGTDPDVGDFFLRLPEREFLPTWHALRTDPAHATELASRYPDPIDRASETRCADVAVVHAATPTIALTDALGRTCCTIAHNKFRFSDVPPEGQPIEEFHATRTIYDIEGHERAVVDAKDRTVMRSGYDMLGRCIHQASMDTGQRWALTDAAGQPLRAWDDRQHELRTVYDALRRATRVMLREDNRPEVTVGRTEYGETLPESTTGNLRGRVGRLFDQAGVLTHDAYDFKGNPIASRRQLAREYDKVLDWSADLALETDVFVSRTVYDAFDRPRESVAPDASVVRPVYNEANLLEGIGARVRGAPDFEEIVVAIDYDAKGQRSFVSYGNGVSTTRQYDPETFRLTRITTTRGSETLQDLHYSYDPVGNITHVRDTAQQPLFFRNHRVDADNDYRYDALYRLIEATGREHLGQAGGPPIPHTTDDAPRVALLHPGDGAAMGGYFERYGYDPVGNVVQMEHRGTDPTHPGWTRTFEYGQESPLEPGKISNRLSSTSVGDSTAETYAYDAHGNMTGLPHLPVMRWDYRDQLQASARQVVNSGTPETTWYVYDAAGLRVRKVTDRAAPDGQAPTRKEERIYQGGFEVFRRYAGDGQTIELERETLHIMDGGQGLALVETRTQGVDPSPEQLTRYQFSNHLGSATLELDAAAEIISYEEYTPYGSTSYQAVRSQTETPKRYRYTGRERDEETGFTHHDARYCAPWLARWTSCDPAGLADGPNLYQYARGNPVLLKDPSGRQPPNPENYGTFQSFFDASPKVFREDYLLQVWEDANGPMASSTPRAIDYKPVRRQWNSGARLFRAAEGMVGGIVQAGHFITARDSAFDPSAAPGLTGSGISRATGNAPQLIIPVTSQHGYGMSATVSGHPAAVTPHTVQEIVNNQAVALVRGAAGELAPEPHHAAGLEARWRLQGTGIDQRDTDVKRASGFHDEAAAIERSPEVQAQRAKGRGSGASPPAAPLPPAGGSILGKTAGALLQAVDIAFNLWGAKQNYEQGDNVGAILNLLSIGPQGIVTGPVSTAWEGVKGGGQLMMMEVDCSGLALGVDWGEVSIDDPRIEYCLPLWSLSSSELEKQVARDYIEGF